MSAFRRSSTVSRDQLMIIRELIVRLHHQVRKMPPGEIESGIEEGGFRDRIVLATGK